MHMEANVAGLGSVIASHRTRHIAQGPMMPEYKINTKTVQLVWVGIYRVFMILIPIPLPIQVPIPILIPILILIPFQSQ